MKHIAQIACLGLLTLAMTACQKEKETEQPSTTTYNALVLNEGGWGANNASLTALCTTDGIVDADWFENANGGRQLGDVAQDIIAYGSKVYATVTFSNSLEVINPSTGAASRVDMGSRNPRHIAADGGKLYITCYNPCSVVRVDTATLAIEATCTLGQFHPEGIAIAQGKAFVASSVTADYSSYDDKLYVVDLATFSNPTTIAVGTNPGVVKKLDEGKVLVCYAGDYTELPAGSAIVDATTLAVTQTHQELAGADTYNGVIYGYASTWVQDPETLEWSQTIGFFSLDPATLTSTPLAFLSDIANPYGINIDPANGDIYITESASNANGDVYCFSQSGSRRFKSEAGIFPKKVIFL